MIWIKKHAYSELRTWIQRNPKNNKNEPTTVGIQNRISNLSNPKKKTVINLGDGLITFEKSIFISASLFRYVTDNRYLVLGMLQYILNLMNDSVKVTQLHIELYTESQIPNRKSLAHKNTLIPFYSMFEWVNEWTIFVQQNVCRWM